MKRVLVQDIAEQLHLSRTTVSKALNGSPNVSQKNRELVLQKAAEMNYKQFAVIASGAAQQTLPSQSQSPQIQGHIAFLHHKQLDKNHIVYSMLAEFESRVSQKGYTISFYSVSDEDLAQRSLPRTFPGNDIRAIMCAELFDRPYLEMLQKLGLPLLMVDTYYDYFEHPIDGNLLLMENTHASACMLSHLIQTYSLSNVGFAGDYHHCLSFYQRWQGFCIALQENSLSLDKNSCIIFPADEDYFNLEKLITRLKGLDPVPDLIFCANDYIAIQIMTGLREIRYSIPKSIMVCGFDDSSLSKVITPNLTTVHSFGHRLGEAAAGILLSKLEDPSLPNTITYVKSEIIYRDSTNRHSTI